MGNPDVGNLDENQQTCLLELFNFIILSVEKEKNSENFIDMQNAYLAD
jgi:hypothetical protein